MPTVAVTSATTTRHLTGWSDFWRTDPDSYDSSMAQRRLRAGPALELTMYNGDRQSISLDHADEAADLLNALLAQNPQRRERSDADVALTTQTSDRSGERRR